MIRSIVAGITLGLMLALPAGAADPAIALAPFASGLERPVALLSPPGDARIFVVEKTGRIDIFKDGKKLDTPFLDVSEMVSRGNEQGLLGLAFHPDFASNGRFYVDYTDGRGDTQIVGFTVSADKDVADKGSAQTLLSIEQPFENHNGGWVEFGPDGLLYVAMGDGGSGGDPTGNGQNKDVLLGKILRIDVDSGAPYGIPPGNPFAKGGGRPEIFLMGVRNPWRNTFDSGLLYVADVGQNAHEEIDVLELADAAGANLGWNTMEGSACYPQDAMCVQGGFVMPVHTYSHDVGCSITGGSVYRGAAIPELQGTYLFTDYCQGVLEGLRYENGAVTSVGALSDQGLGNINSFGRDSAGELYVLADDGTISKLVPAQ